MKGLKKKRARAGESGDARLPTPPASAVGFGKRQTRSPARHRGANTPRFLLGKHGLPGEFVWRKEPAKALLFQMHIKNCSK